MRCHCSEIGAIDLAYSAIFANGGRTGARIEVSGATTGAMTGTMAAKTAGASVAAVPGCSDNRSALARLIAKPGDTRVRRGSARCCGVTERRHAGVRMSASRGMPKEGSQAGRCHAHRGR